MTSPLRTADFSVEWSRSAWIGMGHHETPYDVRELPARAVGVRSL